MTDINDLERRLESMALDPVGPVDAGFADQLDVRLRTVYVEQYGATRVRSSWRPALVGGLALTLVALAAAAALTLGRSPEVAVVLTTASDTSVIFPGDQATSASDGLRLTDGTRIVVGDDGEAVINGVVLGPGTEALVVGDQIDVVATGSDRSVTDSEEMELDGYRDDRSATPTTRRPGDSSAVANDRTSIERETDRDHSDQPDDVGRGTTSTTETRPRSTTLPATTIPSTDPTRSTTSTTGPTTSVAVDQRPDQLELTVTPTDRSRLRLEWSLNREVTGIAGWRVRVENGDRPATVVAIRDEAARTTTVEQSVAAGNRIWIEALDVDGQVLVASAPIDIAGR
jgi:hypothetical protein